MKKLLPYALAALALCGCDLTFTGDLYCHVAQMTLTCTVVDGGVQVVDADAPAEAAVEAGPDASAEASVDASVEAEAAAPDASPDARGSSVDAAADSPKGSPADASKDSPVEASKEAAAEASPPPPAQDAATAQRPAGNTGAGFYVSGRKVFDANGNEFRMRGVDHLHFDSDSVGIPKSGANVERWFASNIASTDVGLANRSLANRIVPVMGDWDGTCDESPATLTAIVDHWVAQAASWKPLERSTVINIANEWGPPDSTAWRDAYVTAVQRMRAAGINSMLVVDSGECGQDLGDIVHQAAAVEAADPQHNVLFDIHLYGFWCTTATGCDPSWQFELNSSLDKVVATGLPVVVGEFGPGRSIGPSPTNMTPLNVMSAAEARGIGWIAWAWDDPAGEFTTPHMCPPSDTWFALSCTGDYASTADLTTFGKSVVEDPTFGLKALAKKATIF